MMMHLRATSRCARASRAALRIAPLALFLLLISIAALAPSSLGTPLARLGGLSAYLALSILLFLAQVLLVLLPTPGETGD
jgi:uncharacterized membrane protein (DUF485 family)